MSDPRPVTRHDYPDSFGAWKTSVEKRLNRLFTRATSAAPAIVGTAGSFIVKGLLDLTGSVSMKTDDGTEILRMGSMPIGRGLEIKRDDGSLALQFRKSFDNSTVQQLALYDSRGDVIAAENPFGGGLYRPHLSHPLQPVAAASGTAVTCGPYGFERVTTSGTFETMFAYDGKAQNFYIDFKFAVKCSDGTTAGELQIIDMNSGVPLPGLLQPAWLGAIPAGTTTFTVIDPTPDQVAVPSTFHPGDQMRLGVQCRRTAGAGTITLAVPQAIGG